MTSETFAYRPTGSGHEGEPRRGKTYIEPRDELKEAFEKWFERVPERVMITGGTDHHWAKELMPDLTGVTAEEVNSLVALYRDDPRIIAAGTFLSVAYNRLKQRTIVFDSDVPIDFVGDYLEKGKRLIIKGVIKEKASTGNSGALINYSPFIMKLSGNSTGPTVNYASTDGTGYAISDLGDAGSGLLVNYGKITKMGVNCDGAVLNFGQVTNIGKAPTMVVNMGICEEITCGGHKNDGVVINAGYMINQRKEGSRFFKTDECKEIPGLLPYLEELKDKLGPHRPPEEVFDVLEALDLDFEIKFILRKAGRY